MSGHDKKQEKKCQQKSSLTFGSKQKSGKEVFDFHENRHPCNDKH